MDYSDFFILREGTATRYLNLAASDKTKSEEEFYNQIKKGKLTFTESIGKVSGDLAIGSWVTTFFSERFVKLLKENKIKSFKTYPIKFKSRHGNKTKYYYLEVNNKLSPRDDLAKAVDIYAYYDKTKKIGIGKKGLYFELNEWDGSDIFGISGTLFYIVTRRLKDIIEEAELKNVVFRNVEDFAHPKWKPIWYRKWLRQIFQWFKFSKSK